MKSASMLALLKLVQPKVALAFIGFILVGFALEIGLAYWVVQSSGVFALGDAWGFALSFIIWSWFSQIVGKVFVPLIRWIFFR